MAADLLFGKMISKHRVNLAITAGATPQKTYELLVEKVKQKSYLKHVHYYNFDEVPFLNQEAHDGVTMTCLKNLYFTPAGIPAQQIHPLTASNYQTHDARLLADGGLDAIFIGIGADGHFCGNLPQTTHFQNETVAVDVTSRPDMADILKNEMVKAGVSDHFQDETVAVDVTSRPDMADILKNEMVKAGVSEDLACDYYVTMGPKSVMAAQQVILMAIGEAKAKIIKQALFGEVRQAVPASILQLHPNLLVLLDEAAAREIMS